ncbi:MAG: InlB B-repeat-containing protein [Treponema sp.]|jgi:beta-glucosidase|nr:InlB B-repeat-containing protein [Treponema sp.]
MKKIKKQAWLTGMAIVLCGVLAGCANSGKTKDTVKVAVTFHFNDGTDKQSETESTGVNGIQAKTASRPGYDFKGWYTQANATYFGAFPYQTHTMISADTALTEPTDVYAAWQIKVAFVQTTAGGSSVVLGITPLSKVVDSAGKPVDTSSYFDGKTGTKTDGGKGPLFKDLNGNAKLDPYEDWRLPIATRVQDLAARLDADPDGKAKMAGLMLYSSHQMVMDPYIGDLQKDFLTNDHLRHVLIMQVKEPKDAGRWSNNVQAYLESLTGDYGIPANNSTDPRHDTGAVMNAAYQNTGNLLSAWPSSLGIAATFNPQQMLKFGQIASAEYRLMGIATALSPQIDIATDPRWYRFNGTFGEDPQLASDMAAAYVRGFQSTWDLSQQGAFSGEKSWGKYSVNAMIKHWPGGGSGAGGQDAHYAYGKYAVYPGGNFNAHLIPFVDGAFNPAKVGPTGGAAAVMPYYTVSYLQVPGAEPNLSDSENAKLNMANAYSRYMISDLLRGAYQFKGVVCTDWNVIGPEKDPKTAMFGPSPGMIWGVDDHFPEFAGYSASDRQHRADKLLRVGVNQFGGLNSIDPIIDAYNADKAAIGPFITESVKALLTNIFTPGLFENPYIALEEADTLLGNEAFVKEGYKAQLDSMVLLKNKKGILPLADGSKVYVPGAASGRKTEATVTPDLLALIQSYFGTDAVITDPAQAGNATVTLVFGASMISGGASFNGDGSIDYKPANLSYVPYIATNSRATSIAGAPQREAGTVVGRANNGYQGKTADPFAPLPGFFAPVPSGLPRFLEDLSLAKAAGKPTVLSFTLTTPMVLGDIEGAMDAILVDFENQKAAVLDMLTGKTKNGAPEGQTVAVAPKGMLPLQLPKDMEAVEAQYEDVPRDMTPYQDAEGNLWDFGFGLTYKSAAPLAIPAAYSGAPLSVPANKGAGPYSITNRMKVSFDYDGDGKADFIKVVLSGEVVSAIVDPLPVKDGSTLRGWNKDGQAWNFDNTVTEDLFLSADWAN